GALELFALLRVVERLRGLLRHWLHFAGLGEALRIRVVVNVLVLVFFDLLGHCRRSLAARPGRQSVQRPCLREGRAPAAPTQRRPPRTGQIAARRGGAAQFALAGSPAVASGWAAGENEKASPATAGEAFRRVSASAIPARTRRGIRRQVRASSGSPTRRPPVRPSPHPARR